MQNSCLALKNKLAGYRRKVFPIRMNAGLMDFSITGADDLRWVFPDGTTSTDTRPAKTLSAAGVVYAYCRDFSKAGITVFSNGTNTLFLGKLSDIPSLIYLLILSGCANITGSLADLQGKVTYLDLDNCVNVTGALADLQGKMNNTLSLSNCANITGSLADLQGKITDTVNISNCVNITGSLADLQGKISYFLNTYNCVSITGSLTDLQGKITHYLNLINCISITGVYTPVGSGVPAYTYLDNTGLSTTDMDNTLIAYAAGATAIDKKNGIFSGPGMTRSAASDDAVATLTAPAPGLNWTIEGITKV